MINRLFGSQFTVAERALDLRVLRQKLLASDIANVDTPGFRALDLDFKESLRAVMAHERAQDDQRAIAGALGNPMVGENLDQPELKVVGVDGLMMGQDSNTANMELLMSRLSENGIQYQIASQMLKAQFTKLYNVIEGTDR